MRYWWVNQNQTFRQEIAGGYLWSPKRNANGGRNPFYESMREVAPGDLIFSFVDTRIGAVGIARSYCWECPKPAEFGSAGQNWVDNISHLLASHCKPWRDSSNEERLNGENGLLLTPSIDHLFDRGFIGFETSGDLIISPVAHKPSLQRMGVETNRSVNVGKFTEGQRHYLDYHRNSVLLQIAR
jgi:hypothetical protein